MEQNTARQEKMSPRGTLTVPPVSRLEDSLEDALGVLRDGLKPDGISREQLSAALAIIERAGRSPGARALVSEEAALRAFSGLSSLVLGRPLVLPAGPEMEKAESNPSAPIESSRSSPAQDNFSIPDAFLRGPSNAKPSSSRPAKAAKPVHSRRMGKS